MKHVVVLIAIACAPYSVSADYAPPEGCEHLVTVRSVDCRVTHFARCEAAIIADDYVDSAFELRRFYEHPTLFTALEHKVGAQIAHEYGPGAPKWGTPVAPGESFAYDRTVRRNYGEAEPGDEGRETLTVGPKASLPLGERVVTVLPLDFQVVGDGDGYLLEERAYLLDAPRISLGGISRTIAKEGAEPEVYDGSPLSLSLPGEPGFGDHAPPPICTELSS